MAVPARETSTKRTVGRSTRDRLQSIVEQIADGVIIAALDGRIRFANPAAELLFGRTADELRNADLGIPMAEGTASEIEIVRPGSGIITAELRAAEIEWEGEGARLISLRDVTDRKRAEERASLLERERLARAEAEAASQAKSDFLATMSHELRTPLNAVIGYSELLALGISGQLADEQRQQIVRIRDSARHLLGLVNEVLDLAKVEAGRLSVQTAAAPVASVVDAAIGLVQPTAEARGVELSELGGAPDVVYRGDEDRVRQILVNLLSNAVKFTDAGGRVAIDWAVVEKPDSEIRLSKGPCVRLRVMDTGIGIPSDHVASIFDPFVQVEGGYARRNEGSGLGLTISRRLARLMGGDLTASSEPGQGSTFTLWLREASAEERDEARWRAQSPDAAARVHGLSDVGATLLRALPTLVDAFVLRLRADVVPATAHLLRTSQVAGHVTAYVADVASVLAAIEEARGQPSQIVTDGAGIQIHIAERHGAQRARLGWSPEALAREWAILCEEIERIIRRNARSLQEAAIPEALIVIERLTEQARDHSIRALSRALEPVDEAQRAAAIDQVTAVDRES